MPAIESSRAAIVHLAAVLCVALPVTGFADLTGQQVDLTYNFGNTSGSVSATVGAGAEFVLEGTGNAGFSTGTIDITADTLTLTHNRNTTLGPSLPNVADDFLIFSFPNLPPQTIDDVVITADPMLTWFAGLAFDGSSITLAQLTPTAGVNTGIKVWSVITAIPPTAASFTGLGELAGGFVVSVATGVSADGGSGGGPVVAGLSESGAGLQAFVWDNGIAGISDLAGGAFQSRGYDISADGTTAVGRGTSAAGTEAFRWSSAGGMTGLGDLSGGSFESIAWGVSGDGAVIVGQGSSAAGTEAFRWTAGGGIVGLSTLAGYAGSLAYDVDASGSVVVGGTFSFGGLPRQAFRWTAATGMVGLGDLPGSSFSSRANAISDDASTIVGSGSTAAGFEAWRWTAATGLVSLGDLPGGSVNAVAQGVSPDGAVVVGFATSDAGTEAFIWDEIFGMRSLQSVLTDVLGLDLSGWTLTEATAVDDDGLGTNQSIAIVGAGTNPDGNTEAWLARIPMPAALPAQAQFVPFLPAGFAAALLGLLAVRAMTVRRRRACMPDA